MTEDTLAVRAYAYAGTIPLRDLAGVFAQPPIELRTTKTCMTARLSEREWCVLHDFGAVVFIGVPVATETQLLAAIRTRLDLGARPPTLESFTIALLPGSRAAVTFDRIVVGSLGKSEVDLVALVVGQSVAMEHYEDDVDRLVLEIGGHSTRLAARGSFRGGTRKLLRFIGRAMVMRNEVVSTLSLLDAPSIAWDDEERARVYRELREAFEIDDRYRALDHKAAMIQENLELLVDLGRSRRSFALEVLVATFIIGEFALALLQR